MLQMGNQIRKLLITRCIFLSEVEIKYIFHGLGIGLSMGHGEGIKKKQEAHGPLCPPELK